ncbi:MAG: GNAT family N-acetyltransferase [Kineosporiaceae bacterium]
MPDPSVALDVPELVVRRCTPADADAVRRLAALDEERVNGRPSQLTEGDVTDWWQSVKLDADSWLIAPDASASPWAVTWLDRQGEDLATWFPLPDVDHRDLLPRLADLAEARAAELGLARLHCYALVPDPLVEGLLRERGYADVRHFFDMAIALESRPEVGALPDGLAVGGVEEPDARAFHAAITESFTDHWEPHPLPFEEWWRLRVDDPAVELPWWSVVRTDSGEVAAALRAAPNRNGGVYVATLGVRRPWRGLGLGKALLRRVFAQAWDAGFRRVTLGVDAASPTGATVLYRGVGMSVESESAVFEKVLQG